MEKEVTDEEIQDLKSFTNLLSGSLELGLYFAATSHVETLGQMLSTITNRIRLASKDKKMVEQ